MEEVISHAMKLGLQVKYRDLGARGAELRSTGLVIINHRYPLWAQREALAHECGHWYHGHDWRRQHDVRRDEREADLYAAYLLTSRAEYRLAERIVGSHPGALARELEISRHLIELVQEDCGRRGHMRRAAG